MATQALAPFQRSAIFGLGSTERTDLRERLRAQLEARGCELPGWSTVEPSASAAALEQTIAQLAPDGATLLVVSLDALLNLARMSPPLPDQVPLLIVVPRRSIRRAIEVALHNPRAFLPDSNPASYDFALALETLDRERTERARRQDLEERIGQLRSSLAQRLRQLEGMERQLDLKVEDPARAASPNQLLRQRLDDAVEMTRRYDVPLSCLLASVQPRTTGESLDDAALARVTGILRRAVRSTDLFGLHGTDRLLILSPYTSPEAAEGLADRLREHVHAQEGDQLELTVAVTSWSHTMESADDLIASAEDRLLRRLSEELA